MKYKSALFIIALLTILVHKYYSTSVNQWYLFWLWFLVFNLSLINFIYDIPNFYPKIIEVFKKDWFSILLLFIFAFSIRIFLLKTYPFLIGGDELRDAGLNGLSIKKGLTKDLFDFGDYQGYGNFIPLISYYFSLILNNSILIFRLPSVLVGVASIILLYFIARIGFNRRVAFLSAFFLSISLHHLHYSRTELLIIMDSLLSLFVLIAFYLATVNIQGLFLAGLMSGFILHFYAGVRGIVFCSALYTVLILGKRYIKDFKTNLNKIALSLLLFFIGFVIGAGPTVNFIKEKVTIKQVGVASLITSKQEFNEAPILEKFNQIFDLYEKAFLTYIFKPTAGPHFSRYEFPFLKTPLNWFFLAGIFFLILVKQKEMKNLKYLILFNIILFPITNEVAVAEVGINHRLIGILPFLNLIAALGVHALLETVNQLRFKIFIIIVIIIFAGSQLYYYYFSKVGEPYIGQDAVKEYVFQEALNRLKKMKKSNYYYFLNNYPYDYNFLQYTQKIEFFIDSEHYKLLEKEEFKSRLKENMFGRYDSIFITFAIDPELDLSKNIKFTVHCEIKKDLLPDYHCPKDFKEDYNYYFIYPN